MTMVEGGATDISMGTEEGSVVGNTGAEAESVAGREGVSTGTGVGSVAGIRTIGADDGSSVLSIGVEGVRVVLKFVGKSIPKTAAPPVRSGPMMSTLGNSQHQIAVQRSLVHYS